MDSGRTLGWSGRLDWPPAPEQPAHGRTLAAHTRPTSSRELAAQPVIDPLVDTIPVGGLHKFNLGMVPASVTPPRTWRQAAWFAIASSAAALGGLMFATTWLADGSSPIEGLDLPGMPRGRLYPSVPASDPYYLTGEPTRPEAVRMTGSVQMLPTVLNGEPSPPSTFAVGGVDPDVPGSPTASSAPTSTTPTPAFEDQQLLLFADTNAIKRCGDEYYAAIGRGDLRSAYSLTTGPLRAEGYEAFAARYSHARSVEVVDVHVTPDSTVHTLRLTKADGKVQTERHELRYTLADEPLIISDKRIT